MHFFKLWVFLCSFIYLLILVNGTETSICYPLHLYAYLNIYVIQLCVTFDIEKMELEIK